jgi:hypothetical protein
MSVRSKSTTIHDIMDSAAVFVMALLLMAGVRSAAHA